MLILYQKKNYKIEQLQKKNSILLIFGGALKYGWDYLFGDTTYEDNGEHTINDQHGSPSTDTRTAYERNEQYLNPWRYANKNWISDFQSGRDIPLGTPEITLRVPMNARKLVPQYDMPGHITYDLRQYNISPGTVTDTERKEAQRVFQEEVEKYQQKKKDYRNYLQERKRLKQEMGKQENEQYWHLSIE